MKNELILAVHSGHNASAALMCNGEILAAALEERFCRKKNYIGYPFQAIEFCLKKVGVKGSELSRVAYTTVAVGPSIFIKSKTSTQFSIRDYINYYGEGYYKRRMRGESVLDYLQWLNTDPKFNEDEQYYDFSYLTDEVLLDSSHDQVLLQEEQRRRLSVQLGISAEQVEFIDHHTCHAYYAYFGPLPRRGLHCTNPRRRRRWS